MQSGADAIEAEQHHAEEARFEEERGQHLIGHQRADHRAGLVGEGRPVGAELVGHHDARHDAHAEGDGENLQPVIEQVDEDLAPGPQPQRFKHREITGEPDREGGEHDVERHRESKLRPGQYDGIPAFEHRHHPIAANLREAYHAGCDNSTAPFAAEARYPVGVPASGAALRRRMISARTARAPFSSCFVGLRKVWPVCNRMLMVQVRSLESGSSTSIAATSPALIVSADGLPLNAIRSIRISPCRMIQNAPASRCA